MARSARAPEPAVNDPAAALSAAEEAQFDQMRADDAAEPAATEPQAPRAPEPEAEGADDAAAEPAPARHVPLATLTEERDRRKQTEALLADERRRMQTLEERTNLILQRHFAAQQQPQQPEPPPLPDVATDPVGHITHKLDQVMAENAQFRQVELQRQQQLNVLNQASQIEQRARALEAVFEAEHQDYPDAMKHVLRARHAELEINGMTDPVARQGQIQLEAMMLAANAIQRGDNPAEIIYKLAKQRGYQTASAAPAEAAPAANGEARLEQIARGQQQARSIGNARGAGPVPMTAQRLLELSGDEFLKMLDTPAGRDLMGA